MNDIIVFLLKALTLAVLCFFVLLTCKKKARSKYFCTLSVLLMLVTVIPAEIIASALPPVTDVITVSALGTKNVKAENDEIRISAFSIDETEYAINSKLLKVVEGKWFWAGDNYCWRNETDTRKPDGVTRSIKLSVPVGQKRSIHFESFGESGIAEIHSGKLTQIIDTFEKENALLDKSSTGDLLWEQGRRLLAFAAVVMTAFGGMLYVTFHYEKAITWGKKNKWHLLFAGIALLQFVHAVHYSGVQSFWFDELCEISWSAQADSLLDRMIADAVPRPIFSCFFYFWYKIAPFGERWLLLPFELGASIGIYLVGLCAERCKNSLAGLFASLFAAFSTCVLINCSYEIRSYPFYFCFGTALLYLNLRRWEHPGQETNREIAQASIVMTLFAGMHAHAVIICVLLFCVDLYQFFKYKIRPCFIIPYVVAAASYIPTLVIAINRRAFVSNWWMGVPTLQDLKSLISFLSGDVEVVIACILFMATVLLAWVIVSYGENTVAVEYRSCAYMFFVCITHIAIAFLYAHIRTNATLWGSRYFIGLIPAFLTLGAVGAATICEWLGGESANKLKVTTIAILLIMFVVCSEHHNVIPSQMIRSYRWRESADWLYQQYDSVYDSSNVIIISTPKTLPNIGWNEYYLTQQGRRDPINMVSQEQLTTDELSCYDTVYVLYLHSTKLDDDLGGTLTEYYQLIDTVENLPIEVYEKKKG